VSKECHLAARSTFVGTALIGSPKLACTIFLIRDYDEFLGEHPNSINLTPR